MPKGKGIYDEEHRDDRDGKADSAEKRDRAKNVPEDTPDVDTGESTSQEPPD